jgi:hypothetical protein
VGLRARREALTIKVGILFNVPVGPKRGRDVDYLAEADVLDQVRAVEDAVIKLGFRCELFPSEGRLGGGRQVPEGS